MGRTRAWRGAAVATLMVSPVAAAADCPERAGAKDLVLAVSAGDAAFADMDEDGFRASRDRVLAALPCLGDGITPGQAALVHRTQALGLFLDRDHAGAVASFRSVLASSPDYRLAEDLAPPGHPMRVHFEVAEGTVPVPEAALPVPTSGWIQVDGHTAATAPVDRPWVYQRFDAGGGVLDTALVRPGAPPPVYEARAEKRERAGINAPLAATAGAAAVASGAFYLASRASYDRFFDPTTAPGQLDTLRARTNTYGWLSAGAGLVAAGAGAGAFLAGTW